MNTHLHRHTPALNAIDSRGLTVRHVDYQRAQLTDEPQARITRHQHDVSGNVVAAWDPRLNDAAQDGPNLNSNQISLFSLSGVALVTRNVDAGERINRYADSGEISESWDSRGTHWQTEYDALQRPVKLTEQGKQETPRVILRFTYVAPSAEAALRNQCARVSREDDSAGTLLFPEYGLLGQPLSETRHFLNALERPDWPQAPQERDQMLEPGAGATTHSLSGPTGDALEQIDARGNKQRSTFDVAGQLAELTLSLNGGSEQRLLYEVSYDANGQIRQQTAGNGVITRSEYDPANGRATRLQTVKPGGASLQDLNYEYDAVGNVIRIEDRAQATRYFANQRIEPVNHFTYDSLYQLITATGREALGATTGPQLPDLNLTPGDTSQLLNYTQHYEYDKGGNLTRLRHVGNSNYTRLKTVATTSNRCLTIAQEQGAPDFGTHFDTNGNLQALQSGQHLQWDLRNQLERVVLLARGEDEDDCQRFIYDAEGTRVRKITAHKAKNTTLVEEVRYLPGLELHRNGDEQLEIVSLQAGQCKVRHLHWVTGKPAGIDNDQHRYGFDDLMSSSSMELDQQAGLLSHEGYYPYGGSAWWAAKSAIQAKYKVLRYSGKERDASGLYYYGQRYYAPWLQQWINPDPSATIDGLNLYRMVGNNPVTFSDPDGRAGVAKSGSNLGLPEFSSAAGRRRKAERVSREARVATEKASARAQAQALSNLNEAVAIHKQVLDIATKRAQTADRQLLNYTSGQQQAISTAKRVGTLVGSSLITTAGAAAGGAIGTMIAPGPGTVAGAYIGGKLAGTATGYLADKTGMSDPVKLKTSPLAAETVFKDASQSLTIDPTAYFTAAVKKKIPTSRQDVYGLAKTLSKSALAKAPFGNVLEFLPEVPELVHENLGATSGLTQAKAAKLDGKLTGLIDRINDNLGSITATLNQLNVSSVSTPEAGNLHKRSTAADLTAETLKTTTQLRKTLAMGR